MVVFRYDVLPRLQHHSMALPVADNHKNYDSDDDEVMRLQEEAEEQHPYSRLSQTVFDQGHLVPVAGTPIYWNYNHALSLYPLPDCLVLSSSGSGHMDEGYTERYCDCRVVVPGSMARQGSYTVYQAELDEDTNNTQDSDAQEGNESVAVEFVSVDGRV